MSISAVEEDVFKKYGKHIYLVETFVDIEFFKGTCYRSANWIEVGMTKDRGRNDLYSDTYKTRKAIFLYPLVSDFR